MRFLLLVVSLFLTLPIWSQDTALAQFSQLLTSFYRYEAVFTQETSDVVSGEQLQYYKGTIALRKPNKLYWQTLSPSQQTIISDGEKVWYYDAALEQVIIKSADELKSEFYDDVFYK